MTDAAIITVVGMILTAIASGIAAIIGYLSHRAINVNSRMTAKIEEQTNGGFSHLRGQLANAEQVIISLKHEVAQLKSDIRAISPKGY